VMKPGHHATAAPVGLGLAWSMVTFFAVNVLVAIACGALVVRCSTLNDLDHPRFKGKMHPGAWLVRCTAWLGYQWRTGRDQERADFQRGPSHCIEWCALVGVVVWALTAQIPWISQWAPWWGLAVGLGCLTHVLADWPTLSGVPISCVYNYLVHGEVWRRHSLRWFATDSAGEKFLAIPILFALTGVMGLAMVGLLGPLVHLLIG
jgi:hypothetical protein